MGFLVHPSYFRSSVATAPSPATSGTTLIVSPGDGTNFSEPSEAWILPAGQPFSAQETGEQVRVAMVAGDTLTIIRNQSNSGARSVQVGDWVYFVAAQREIRDIDNVPDQLKIGAMIEVYHITTVDATLTQLTVDPSDTSHVTEYYRSGLDLNGGKDGYLVTVKGRYEIAGNLFVHQDESADLFAIAQIFPSNGEQAGFLIPYLPAHGYAFTGSVATRVELDVGAEITFAAQIFGGASSVTDSYWSVQYVGPTVSI